MNIFNDAARPHDATWLSPFFVVIEFSKAMWQIRNDFKKNLPVTETRTSFARLREVNLLSCLSDGLDRLVHCLKPEAWRAIFDSSGTLPPPYGSQQVLSPFLPSANVARNDSDSCAVMRALATAQKPVENNNPMSNHMQSKCYGRWKISGGCKKFDADCTNCIIINNTYGLFQAELDVKI